MKVGVLSSGYLVLIDISVARFHGGSAVEWSIQASGYFPIFTVVKHLLQSNACNRAEQNFIKSTRTILMRLVSTPLQSFETVLAISLKMNDGNDM